MQDASRSAILGKIALGLAIGAGTFIGWGVGAVLIGFATGIFSIGPCGITDSGSVADKLLTGSVFVFPAVITLVYWYRCFR